MVFIVCEKKIQRFKSYNLFYISVDRDVLTQASDYNVFYISVDRDVLTEASDYNEFYISVDRDVSTEASDYNVFYISADRDVLTEASDYNVFYISVDRDVLTEASDYFSAMFSHNMREKEQDVIELHDISPAGCTAMMEYFYHGHVTVHSNNIEDIIEAARFFHIEWLVNVCCDFLKRHLSLADYHTVLELDDKFYLGDLRSSIFQFVSGKFIELAHKPKFMEISFDVLQSILGDNMYMDASEGLVFQVVKKWLEHDPEGRHENREQLLKLIRYSLMEEEELKLIPEEYLEMPSIRELVDYAVSYHATPSKQCLMTCESTEVRGAQDGLVLFSAIDDVYLIQYKLQDMDGFFSVQTDTMFTQSVFEFSSVAVLGNFLFVAGGYNRHSWCSSPAFYRFNPRNHSWATLTKMRMPRVTFCLCAGPSQLYALAGINHIIAEGMDQEVILDSVEVYDPEENIWNYLPNLPFGCFSAAATVCKDTVYLTGGITNDPEDNVPTSYVHAYMPQSEEWVPRARMLVERQGHSITAYNDRLYVVGGHTQGEDTMSFSQCYQQEVYDIETDQWSLLKDNPSPHYGAFINNTACFNDAIYLVSQQDQQSLLYKMNPENGDISEGEICGENVRKMVVLQVAFPPELM